MPLSTIALFVGLLLGVAAALGSWSGFLVTLVLGAIGFFVGKVLEGEVDLTPYLGGKDRRQL